MKVATRKFPRTAVDALEKGRKFEAIKLVKAAYGGKSRSAKQAVENFLDRNPRLKNRMDSAKAENALSGVNWLFIIAGICAAIYFFF